MTKKVPVDILLKNTKNDTNVRIIHITYYNSVSFNILT